MPAGKRRTRNGEELSRGNGCSGYMAKTDYRLLNLRAKAVAIFCPVSFEANSRRRS
jgi:hypothetical protein